MTTAIVRPAEDCSAEVLDHWVGEVLAALDNDQARLAFLEAERNRLLRQAWVAGDREI